REITRDDLTLIPYGRDAPGEFRISSIEMIPGKISFTLSGWDMEFRLRVPGEHNVLNATAAIALAVILLRKEGLDPDRTLMEKIRKGLAQFSGGNRRSEIIGETGGVLFMDDYGHHPTEISKTLSGLRDFFPDRRLVVDFMSHTYSRTRGLMEEFSKSFKAADEVILHHIYPSAREEDDGAGLDEELFEKVSFHHPKVSYFHEIMDAVPYLEENLKNGDLFITMGAGDNWTLGKKLYESFKERFKDKNRKME
ncbi:MAG: UDP-N-acetylmuramate--L-alanine ligase, partial [Spirochaetales bacterium]|nr:UDP-N-acetylmuramate--L-alanine ligase [Spirochaetales bacterium]